MEKLERLHAAYNYLRDNGMAHTQTDVANKMGATKQNVSSAMRGIPKVLTDNFLQRFASAYGFNAQWLIYGSGDMVSQPQNSVVQLNHVQKGSPVYDIDATCGLQRLNQQKTALLSDAECKAVGISACMPIEYGK